MTKPNQKVDQKLIFRALTFAADKHRHQTRKGSKPIPYVNHPIAVADLLVNVGHVTDTDTIVAALLHDTIEDTETNLRELENEFSSTVAKLVAELSDDKNLTWNERKQHQIKHAPTLSPRARLIKLADKTCNLRDVVSDPPKGWSLQRKQGYFDWAKKVIDKIRGTSVALEKAFDEAFSQKPDGIH
jgi:GTP diphosphokinase / guanosine-3',5'-bis(diphosphate) 3'-diphosphatase